MSEFISLFIGRNFLQCHTKSKVWQSVPDLTVGSVTPHPYHQVGIPESKTAADAVIDLQTTASGIERRTHDHVKAALLDAAEMIRVLRIILDGKE